MLGRRLGWLLCRLLGHLLGCLLGDLSIGFVAGFSVGSRVGQVSCRALEKSVAKRRYELKPDADNCANELRRLVADSERQVLPRPLLVYYCLA